MIIEVQGIGFPNKGAELMLAAICQHFDGLTGDYQIVLPTNGDYLLRARHGTYQKAELTIRGLDLSTLWSLVPARIRNRYGIVLEREVDAVLDASGFAYGDQWGAEKFQKRVSNKLKNWKRRGTRVVFLPQAFGPFSSQKFKSLVHTLLATGYPIYAREPESLCHLDAISPGIARECPDFTSLIKPPAHPQHYCEDYGICFIPNHKMVSERTDGAEYVTHMARALVALDNKEERVCILVHEGQKDFMLAEQIREKSGIGRLPILNPTDALEIKYVISRCKAVVSSRFHGLVSALSQQVPAVATGWSHKYQQLMNDYGCAELMVEDITNLTEVSGQLADQEFLASVRRNLLPAIKICQERVRTMWTEVDRYLGLGD